MEFSLFLILFNFASFYSEKTSFSIQKKIFSSLRRSLKGCCICMLQMQFPGLFVVYICNVTVYTCIFQFYCPERKVTFRNKRFYKKKFKRILITCCTQTTFIQLFVRFRYTSRFSLKPVSIFVYCTIYAFNSYTQSYGSKLSKIYKI